jgi:putative heme-binding domain-containing protein
VYQQIRALEVLVELFGGLTDDEARKAALLARPTLAARVAWALSRQPTEAVTTWILAGMTYDDSPRVTRAAWEAIATLPKPIAAEVDRRPNWAGAADSNDCRRVRAAMLVAARNVGLESFNRVLGDPIKDNSPNRRLARLWFAERLADGEAMPDEYFDDCFNALNQSADPAVRLEALRLIQLGLGDLHIQPDQPEVYSGYTGNATGGIDLLKNSNSWFLTRLSRAIDGSALSNAPTRQVGEIKRELARVLAMISAGGTHLPLVIISFCTTDSSPVDDIHFLIVLSRLTGPRLDNVTLATAMTLVGLHRKMAARRMYPDANWPLRVGEMFDELCRRDPRLARAVAESPGCGLPAHSLFAAHMQGEERQHAARRLLKVAQSVAPDDDDESHWTPELVTVVASLADEECLPVLREQWSDFGLRDAIALVLAARAAPEDRSRLVEALASPQGDVVTRAADALASLGTSATPAELADALRTLKAYCAAPEQRTVRLALAKLLSAWSGEEFEVPDPEGADLLGAYAPWFEWFAKAHPDESKKLAGFGGADATAWRERLVAVDWDRGDRARGKLVFEKRSCNRCHIGGGRLGPDLAGAARRFSRDDLFAAIVDPSRDVSPLYQTTLVATRAGQVYHGLLVYDSADGLLLQTGPDITIRVTGDDIQSTRPSRQSLMPTGLLNDVNDDDLADLYVYLKELSKSWRPTRQSDNQWRR